MSTDQLLVESADEMEEFGRRLAGRLRAGDLVVLDGPLGAGKTTLSRGLGAGMSVRGAVTSPTFVIARRHPALGAGPDLLHIDAYRLTRDELEDLQLDEEAAQCVTLVEWGRGKVEAWSDNQLLVAIALTSDDPQAPREVTVTGMGPRWSGAVLAEDHR